MFRLLPTRAAKSAGQHVCPQQQHRARLSFRKRISQTTRVAANKFSCNSPNCPPIDMHIRQLAKTGVDTVDVRFLLDNSSTTACAASMRVRASGSSVTCLPTACNVCNLLESKSLSAELNHGIRRQKAEFRRQNSGDGIQESEFRRRSFPFGAETSRDKEF